MSFFESESTGRANQNIDEILRENMEETYKNIPTIGPIPESEPIGGYPGQELGILNPLEWMGGAGVAGRLGKTFFTGGSPMKRFLEKYLKKHPKTVKEYNALNKTNKERLMAEKALDKHGIPHNPIEETDIALRKDPISFLLAKLKESRKPDF